LLANDLPGVEVAGALAEGASNRQTDLVLSVADKPALTGDATLDNAGGLSTGANRLSVNAFGNSLLGLSELWSLSALANQGSTYARLGLSAPVGYDGLRVGLNAYIELPCGGCGLRQPAAAGCEQRARS
jgi:hemolysin activation/secretion protein